MAHENMSVELMWNDAVGHHLAGRLAEAEVLYRQLLELDSANAAALHMLGVLQFQCGQGSAALELIGRAVALWQQAVQLGPADDVLAARLAAAHNDAGVIQEQLGRGEAALESFAAALACQPHYAEAWFNMGKALAGLRRLDQAIAAYQRAIALRPDMPDAYNSLGVAQFSRGLVGEAIASYRAALAGRTDDSRAWNNLGTALRAVGRWTDAVAAYQRAVQIAPRDAEVWNNLGSTCDACGEHEAALQALGQALALRPGFSAAHNNLGNVLKNLGDLDGALAAFERAIDSEPGNQEAHSNRLYTMYFHPDYSARQIHSAHQCWNSQHAARLCPASPRFLVDRSPSRRLRIGYLGAQFRDHCQALFLKPLWSNHDPEQVEVIAYSDVAAEDAVTTMLRGHASGWRRIAGLADEAVAEQIRQDRIDVLVDLTLHMAHSRLLVLARRPAPVQISWLGYPGTTGLQTIDYRLTDPYLDPLSGETDAAYSERSYRLPHTFWCYDPLAAEPVHPLPALRSGCITFGCLNNFCKVTEPTLRLWAAVLRAVPGSKLLLLAPRAARERVAGVLARQGIAAERIEFVDRAARPRYLAYYHRIDVALDTIPYNGHTTTLDALWMGVPVITVVGSAPAGRAGWSQLSNLGLEHLAAASPEEFPQLAAELAADLARLAELRDSLRDRLLESPLCDGRAFARAMEAAFHFAWREFLSPPALLAT